jgi:DNA/RNA endonuclease YhcR with UshA esterase domain
MLARGVFHGGLLARPAQFLLPNTGVDRCAQQPGHSKKKLTAAEAKDHVGETATVCGSVVSARYAASTKGQPTFLNLDKPYPNRVFTVLIWGENRSKFGTPESEYKGKRICITGKITEYRGMPEIAANASPQIRFD